MAWTYPTSLVISGEGIPPYASRGLTQEWAWIDQASQIRRTINGSAKDLSLAQFRKIESTISGSDQLPPKAYIPGTQVTVSCIFEMAYKTSGGAAERTVVAGSSRTEGAWTFYRPQLTMRVASLNVVSDEYGAVVNWSMALTEV